MICSKKTTLCIDNRTSKKINNIHVSVDNADHWDPKEGKDPNIEVKFGGASINAHSHIKQSLEITRGCWDHELEEAAYTMKLTFDDGSTLEFSNHQKDANESHDRVHPCQCEGPTKFVLKQVSGNRLVPQAEISITHQPAFSGTPENIMKIYEENALDSNFEPKLNLASWMSNLPDDTSITKMAIPGTHDTGTYYGISSSLNLYRSQAISITDQLKAGIRYFDLRGASDGQYIPKDDRPSFDGTKDCQICHGDLGLGMNLNRYPYTFQDFFEGILTFLMENPSEVVFIQIKADAGGDSKNSTLGNIVKSMITELGLNPRYDHYLKGKPIMDTKDWGATAARQISEIKLDQVRGRIMLVDRTYSDIGFGINHWSDKANNAWYAIQDNYKYVDDRLKVRSILNFHDTISTDISGSGGKFKISFLSCASLTNSPKATSDAINPLISKFYRSQPSGWGGVVLMDFAGIDDAKSLVEEIIAANPFKPA